jgi:hypothetical protein
VHSIYFLYKCSQTLILTCIWNWDLITHLQLLQDMNPVLENGLCLSLGS